MARARTPERDQAFQIYKESGGKISNREIARRLNLPEKTVGGWKCKDKWEVQLNGVLQKEKRSTPNKPGAPKGNKNAIGNPGGPGGPPGNKKAEVHGFFSRIFPDDPETQAIVAEIGIKSPLDILWENIVIQYTAIARAQKLMFVKDQQDLTQILKRQKEISGLHSDGWEKEYELQFAWDKHATFLAAQSRAIKTLEGLIARYEELLPGALQYEEQRLRVEKLKAELAGLHPPDDGSLADLSRAIRESEPESEGEAQ